MHSIHNLFKHQIIIFIKLLEILIFSIILVGCATSGSTINPTTDVNPPTTINPTEEPTQTKEILPSATSTPSPPTNTTTPEPTNTPTPTSTATQTPLPGSIIDEQGIEMILIPAGSFIMGSDNNQAAAKPAHEVYLDAYYIDKFEVTNERYLECLEDGYCNSGGSSRLYNSIWDNHPVMDVTWYEAQDYCQWRGGRLPTEAEWEKAARGTDERLFPWGNEPVTCERARYGDCGWFTVQVGQHPDGVSPYGVHDMAGNAWEWTLDWYKQDYYSYSPLENPQGPSEDTGWKSTRGGAWFYMAGLMTAVWRNHAPPSAAYSYLGFRCINTP